MAAANDYLRILGELGVDTDQLAPKSGLASRILKSADGERVPGIYVNRQGGGVYFTVNPGAATVEIDWNLWQNVSSEVAVPYFDQGKHNIVPRPGMEERALRSLLGLPAGGGFMNFLRRLFGGSSG